MPSKNLTLRELTLRMLSGMRGVRYDATENLVEKVADLLPNLITVHNVNTGRVLFVNSSFETLLGYKINTLNRRGIKFILSHIHPDDAPKLSYFSK